MQQFAFIIDKTYYTLAFILYRPLTRLFIQTWPKSNHLYLQNQSTMCNQNHNNEGF